eukprot:3778097-Prymnesium_polylepis.1
MSASTEVFGNRDVSRAIVGHHSRAGKLLVTSHEHYDDPCRALLMRWALEGCPRPPATQLQRECLSSIGGLGSRFCRGTWELKYRDGRSTSDVDGASVAQTLANELNTVEKSVVAKLGSTTLQIYRQEKTARYTITATVNGWRRKGARCQPTAAQVAELIRSICTQTGPEALPCPEGGATPLSVAVPRMMSLELKWGGVVELTASRR